MTAAAIIDGASRPGLSPHVRLKEDQTRGGFVLLAPERVLLLDQIAAEVLSLCDGEASVAEIAGRLAERHQAPPEMVLGDVIEMLQNLRDKGLLTA